MNKDSLSHKELLTFSNLTNLEWEFVNLTFNNDDEKKRSTQLKDLLIPGVFARTIEENGTDRRKYSYGDTGDEDYDKELGLAEMRQKAGIAMEYKEKLETGNQEGKFLKEWEVVYAADNYKAVADYLDYKSRLFRLH